MLAQKAKYTIKDLVVPAQQKEAVRTQDIADHINIPKKFLNTTIHLECQVVSEERSPQIRNNLLALLFNAAF
jgi:hypothetical protein